ncbi:cytochrome P450 98A3 [Fomes fomentarius]|nr:cytochrome P450 98A3 [Fomes fomentarius]
MSKVLGSTMPYFLIALAITTALYVRRVRKTRRSVPLPPGPLPLPLIGNALNMPRRHLGREFMEMSKKYGDVVYLDALGQPLILLGSYRAASDLLDKRSSNYSDRPASFMVQQVGFDWLMPLMGYGQEWRQHRRELHRVLNPEIIVEYQDIQLMTVRNFLRSLLETPLDLSQHLKFAFAAMIMRIVYGIELREHDDRYYQMVERMAQVGEEISVPGRFPVESVPLLRFLPSWFPGGGYKRFATAAKRDIHFAISNLFDTAKGAMDEGSAKESFVTRLLQGNGVKEGEDADLHIICKNLGGSVYVAAADTTFATMEGFFLAMARFPEVQRKAQYELDSVVGSDRLPEFSDKPSLPYLSALVKELLRWHVVTPIGVPHRVMDDDEYRGHFIPGGATIFVNAWALSRDADIYPGAEIFRPERFLMNGQLALNRKDPSDYVFGFGRRICPGRHFAEAALFIFCASILHAFRIDAPVDEYGNHVEVDMNIITNAAVSHVPAQRYKITPRSASAECLIRDITEM